MRSIPEVLEDESIQLIASAAIPDERAGIGVAAMRHARDYFSDKPALTSLDQLEEARHVQRQTRRIFSVSYSERLQNRATVRAGELVKAGAIGTPLQTVGLGPPRLDAATRPAWFFEHARYGGILTDIGSHQADQFLFFTGSTTAEVVVAQVGNLAHPEYPGLDDFGDVLLRGDGGSGYIECREVALPFGPQLLDDVRQGTETAMPQAHAFLASELALRAQLQAQRVGRQAVVV